MTAIQVVEWSAPYCAIDYEKLITHVADWVDPESITEPDPRPILCRGYRRGKPCQCREFVRWRTIGGYVECYCGDSEQTHKVKTDKKRTVKR